MAQADPSAWRDVLQGAFGLIVLIGVGIGAFIYLQRARKRK